MSVTAIAISLAVAVIVCVAGVLALKRYVLSASVQGRGAPDGSWAIAGGASMAGLTITLAGARGVPFAIAVRLFGRTIVERKLAAIEAPKASPEERPSRIVAWLKRRIDLWALAVFLFEELRLIHIKELDAEVELGLHDAALAGQIAGGLAVISALVSPLGALRYNVDWSGKERLAVSGSIAIAISPARIAWDTGRFVMASGARGRERRALPSTTRR